MELRDRIIKTQRRLGATDEEMAQALGCSRQTYNRLKNGQSVSLGTQRQVAHFLFLYEECSLKEALLGLFRKLARKILINL